MKNYFKVFITITTLMFATAIFAADKHYAILVDAGSTGSRLHLFQYEKDQHNFPVIVDIFSKKVSPGLSSFEKNPEEAGKSLKVPFDLAKQELEKKGVKLSDVTVSVMGTAGMRLLSTEAQNKIYENVKTSLASDSYASVKAETISGKMEGVYGWLDINYLSNTFQSHTQTLGAIDIGGASVQVTFVTQDTSKPEDEITFNLDGQKYTVFSKSFLKMGLDQAREEMNKNPEANSCYPLGYNQTGNFSFATCSKLYADLIDKNKIAEQMMPLMNQQFIAYSGAYYTYHFFKVDELQADKPKIDVAIKRVCSQKWEDLLKQYPADKDFLHTYCSSGVYLENLLYGAYKLQNDQLSVASEIKKQGIDWTLGAMLYSLIK